MSRTRYDGMDCPIALALDQIGDWWSLLIVREAMMGVRRFVDFDSALGISKNILTNRLTRLVGAGVLKRHEAGVYGSRAEYELTDKGRDLFVVITALRQWGDHWVYGGRRGPAVLKDKASGKAIPRMRVRDAAGKPVELEGVFVQEIPGWSRPRKKKSGGSIRM